MLSKPKIIFVGDYSREDYVGLLEAAKGYCEFYFLFYASANEEKSSLYKAYGKAIYWKDFKSAQQLLKAISPDKVVLLYIESYNHVVLNLACRSAGVPTYLLEHGLRADYVFGFDPQISPGQENTLRNQATRYYQIARDFIPRIKSRRFLNQSIKQLSPNDQQFVNQFIEIRSKHNYLDTFRQIHSEKRLADNYIGFSSKILEAFEAHEAPYFGGNVNLIGIPYFDKLALLKPEAQTKSILLIDQPLAEQGLLQWTKKYKEEFAAGLAAICIKQGYQLYIKPHPKQKTSLWDKLERQGQCIVIDDEKLRQLAPVIPVVLGFYSTYLMPFAAYTHTTVITYEKHPAGKYFLSKPLVDAGVAHPIHTLEELNIILPDPEKLHQRQLPNKVRFTEEWMYKFDGKSGERLRDILLSTKP
ncbi:hypothetical protein ABID22_000693 [Pontibacter aydingkolensis]|uniref:Alpha-2,8-polysialyltransferase family protein n=1 Tax=Pontibacter aydingkolensis TaxID=1911536 RepID=A0ABS7CRE5_9BACT|nr:alpha-2,8-polysialyltransferase family protein [Pontibacter aydingkolensis]MBW7466432.1 alpha-2,8-polysialyltransferase family protein [Pontibacter aydingkolensis]